MVQFSILFFFESLHKSSKSAMSWDSSEKFQVNSCGKKVHTSKNWSTFIQPPRNFAKIINNEVVFLAKFGGDWIRIVDFLLVTNFWRYALFFHQTLFTLSFWLMSKFPSIFVELWLLWTRFITIHAKRRFVVCPDVCWQT